MEWEILPNRGGVFENNLQWGEEYVTSKFIHIVETYQHPTSKNLFIYKPKNDQCYYVDMPRNLIVIEIDVVNQNEGNFQDIQELM